MHSQLAGDSQVKGAIVILQVVKAAFQRDADSCLDLRNLTKFSTFQAQCPGLNKPWYHFSLHTGLQRSHSAAEVGSRVSMGQQHALVGEEVQSCQFQSECSCVSAQQKMNIFFESG